MKQLVAFLTVTLPALALACPVCGTAKESTRNAFMGTTIVMSLLPLAIIGGGMWWLWRRSQELDSVEPGEQP